jgi:hypothetical protein
MTTQTNIETARQQVRLTREFYTHVAVYLTVNALLLTLNALTGGPWWALWPLFGWGIGLAAHGVGLYARRALGPEWEERQVRKLAEDPRR